MLGMLFVPEKKISYRVLQLLNSAGLLLVIVFHFLSVFLPFNELRFTEVMARFHNFFVPARFTYLIWILIYTMLGAFVYNQLQGFWNPEQKELVYVRKLSYLFFTSCVLQAMWFLAWHFLELELAVGLRFLLLINLIFIYTILHRQEHGGEKYYFLTRAAFSFYVGWIIVELVINFNVMLVQRGEGWFGLPESIWVIGIMILMAVVVMAQVINSEDALMGLAALWAYFGILMARMADVPPIRAGLAVVGISMMIIAAGVVWVALRSERVF